MLDVTSKRNALPLRITDWEVALRKKIVGLTDADLTQLKDDLAARAGRARSNGVLIDVTAVDVMDSFATRILNGMAQITERQSRDVG